MASISDPRGLTGTIVNTEEPAVKPPPLLAVGPLAWIRNNLFRSTLDTILTLGFAALAIAIISGVLAWTIQQANWFVITENLRLFMVGRFPTDALWRAEWVALFIMFIAGFGIATWSRISRTGLALIIILLALVFIIPRVTQMLGAPPVAALAAGSAEIASGTVTATPVETVGFIGAAGTEVSFRYPDNLTDDTALANIAAFTDRASAAVANNARNRLSTLNTLANMEARLAGDALTDEQRAALTEDIERFELPASVVDTLAINSAPVHVQVLAAESGQVIAEATLPTDGDQFDVTLPEDGWYILNKTVADENSIVVLEAVHLEPLLISELSARDIRFRTLVSDFETSVAQPREDGVNLPIVNIIDYQFSGPRSFNQFMQLQFGPLLDQMDMPLLILALAAAVGYGASRFVERTRPNHCIPGQRAGQVLTGLLLIAPIVIAILLASVNTMRWGGLLLTFMLTAVGIVLSFPIGVLLALGRRSNLPIVKVTSILFIEVVRGVPLITVLFIANLMLPLLHPSLATIEGVYRAMAGITLFSAAYLAENVRGGLQSVPPGQEEAARALGLSSAQVTLFITLPQALRAVIPALVGQAIALFKDTSLVAIIGLFDLTRIADSVIVQPEFIGARPEAYLFISIIYFIFSYLMAWASRRIEASGSGAARQF